MFQHLQRPPKGARTPCSADEAVHAPLLDPKPFFLALILT
jgi:hypothetical protein